MLRLNNFIVTLLVLISLSAQSQLDGETTPSYPELIEIYKELAANNSEIELYNMGDSDFGLPIYVCLVNACQDSVKSFNTARNKTTVLINNGIHPGEPDGINASLIWINEWIKGGKKTKNLPIIAIIPSYNVGGTINRSSSSRANQDGPQEYGFRGNAQNLDLNRDFIKMDSKNMMTFARIFHALDPDVFVDTHVSNGADYQYTLTYIASVKERMAPSLAKLTHDEFIPLLEKDLMKEDFDLIPYVNLVEDVPEKGMSVFNDLPRYSMGYASLFNTISFTVETHMLKPFNQRTKATLEFLRSTIDWTGDNMEEIEVSREKAFLHDLELAQFPYNYQLSEDRDSILFHGYEFSHPKSEVTGYERLKYHQDQPYAKFIPYYQTYTALDTIDVPAYYVIGGQCTDVIERLKMNGVVLKPIDEIIHLDLESTRIASFLSSKQPYEGHFLHWEVKTSRIDGAVLPVKQNDVVVSTNQRHRRFIVSVLEPKMADSYFAWNFFDSYLQQKEHFSSYVFEDKASEILKSNPALKIEFESKKLEDEDFRVNPRAQLDFIYKHSEYYEPTHNVIPIQKGF